MSFFTFFHIFRFTEKFTFSPYAMVFQNASQIDKFPNFLKCKRLGELASLLNTLGVIAR